MEQAIQQNGLLVVFYILASILFILSLGGLSNPETSRRGNWFGIIGMALAVAATLFHPQVSSQAYGVLIAMIVLAGPPLLDEDYLILSTMHSAKGLEFDVVYVMHAADGNIPSDMATGSAEEIEEERRLLYVACTRAREQLYVTHPLRYYTQPWAKADTHGYAQRSRFLTPAVLAHFEQVQTGPEQAEGAECPLGRVTPASIRAGVRALWEAPAEA